jgi:predicted RecB family nuclease
MLNVGEAIHLTASDLVGHLDCHYLTNLDRAVVNGILEKPKVWDPFLEVLAERGALHERGYIEHLRGRGYSLTFIDEFSIDRGAVAKTLAAMKAGAQIIVQGTLQSDRWSGRADILRRVDGKSSAFGSWSYEVIDTKLARETKGGTVIQICLYSDLLAAVQQCLPEFAYVVVPENGYEPQAFRIADYLAYYRRVRRSLEKAVKTDHSDTLYPEPNPHCEICRWRNHCDKKRHADDHLSLVAVYRSLKSVNSRSR